MNELQKRLLLLLEELDEICKKHNITYYIDGGSAIGAIRHHGFIPWDDDIDIVMTRKNFEKFESIIDKEISKDRKYESIERNPKYTMVYARYCDRTTTNILRTSLLDVFESGVFIDIFVLDPIPSDKKIQEKYLKKFRAYAEYINPYYYDAVVSGNNFEMLKMRLFGKILGKKRLHKYIKKKLFSYEEEKCDYYCFRFDLFPFIYPKEYFQKPRYMQFEELISPVPTMIEEYLQVHYGDTWMIIPKHDEQETHNVVINLNVPYQTFKNCYINQIKKDAYQQYEKFHQLRVNKHNATLNSNKGIYKLNAINYELKFKKELQEYNISKLFSQKKYSKLYEIFQEYYDVQLNKNYLKNNVVINIENSYYALKLLINLGYYYKTKKVLNILDDKYDDLKNEVELITKLNNYYYKKDLKNYFELVSKYYEQYGDVIDFIRGMAKKLISEHKYYEANKLIDKSLEIYINDDFLLKYKADILFEEKKEEAINLYNQILEMTNNGILILEIKDILGGN